MRHDDIIQEVKTILNEHGGEDMLMISEDRVLLDAYIERAIPDAVTLLGCKGHRVNANVFGEVLSQDVPEGYIGLVCLKLKTWNKAVTRETVLGSPEYNMAMNGYTAPKANSPVVFVEGDKFVALPVGDVEYGEYNVVYDANEGIEARPKEATAVCYMAAALVCGFFGDVTDKQILMEMANGMLQ